MGPQQPVETLFKHIQDCVDFAESSGVTIGTAQKLSSAYSKIFKSGKLNSACRRWDEKVEAYKTWNSLKIHVASAYRQHRQIQEETVGAQAYANAVAQSEDDLAEQALGAFTNLPTATAVDRGVVAQLTASHSHFAKQFE
jgi:ADP-dependent phosphofructokinase/glucokinase